MIWGAVIVAAGRGTRFGKPKQLVPLAGLPMAGWSIRAFDAMDEIAEIVVVTEPEWIGAMGELAATIARGNVRVVAGGASRQESVYNGVVALSPACEGVLVHDGARPLVRADEVRAAMREVGPGRAAVLAVPVVDTIKIVDPGTRVVRQTLERSELWSAQTPQLSLRSRLLDAHERARRSGLEATDDVALIEAVGDDVVVVPASPENFKITYPSDVLRAEAILHERLEQPR
jgi:2-C-methyl-D-erythritol 4-phosphate cytidylyltransferase